MSDVPVLPDEDDEDALPMLMDSPQCVAFGIFVIWYVIQGTEYRVQDTEYRVQGTEYRAQVTGYRVQSTSSFHCKSSQKLFPAMNNH